MADATSRRRRTERVSWAQALVGECPAKRPRTKLTPNYSAMQSQSLLPVPRRRDGEQVFICALIDVWQLGWKSCHIIHYWNVGICDTSTLPLIYRIFWCMIKIRCSQFLYNTIWTLSFLYFCGNLRSVRTPSKQGVSVVAGKLERSATTGVYID